MASGRRSAATYAPPCVTTVDRRRWIENRLRFLQGLLDEGASDADRPAIESEMAALRKEAGSSHRWLRWLGGIPRRPTDR